MVAQVDKIYLKARPWKIWSRLISYGFFEGRPLTTRARWINPVLFAAFGLLKVLPHSKLVKAPAFILGTGRSGTTVLGVVLSMHREVGFLNEPKAIWHAIYPREDLIGSYSRQEARYRLFAQDACSAVIGAAHKIFGAYLSATFSHQVIDKYPELIFRVPFVRRIFPDAKFIFLVRNGWDTCHSIEGWSHRLGTHVEDEQHDWWGVDRRKWNLLIDQLVPEHEDLALHAVEMRDWTQQTDMAAVEWIVTMREGLKVMTEFPNDSIRIDYEVICEAPRKSLTEISEFLALSGDEVFLNYGDAVLVPNKQKEPFELNKAIREPFANTMKSLGYE